VIRRIRSFDAEEGVAILHGSAIFRDDATDGSGALGLDFVHDFHCLDDAEGLADGNGAADFHEVRGVGCGFRVEGADHGGGDFHAIGDGSGSRSRGAGGGCWGGGALRGVGGRATGGECGHEAAEIVKIRAFFQFQVKVLFGEVEVGEPVLIHEFDDSTDFLEFHGEKELVVGVLGGRAVRSVTRRGS
jgi:hypothetical protein